MRSVFERTAAVMPAPGVECFAFGLLVTAFDGTVFDLATEAMCEAFATPSGGSYPQARMVALVVCGNRWIAAARLGSCATREQALVDTMAEYLRPGTLNLAEGNFLSLARWVRFADTGAHLAWRVKRGRQPARPADTSTARRISAGRTTRIQCHAGPQPRQGRAIVACPGWRPSPPGWWSSP
jgi:hypothetical protein